MLLSTIKIFLDFFSQANKFSDDKCVLFLLSLSITYQWELLRQLSITCNLGLIMFENIQTRYLGINLLY